MKLAPIVVIAAVCTLLMAAAHAGKLYKWVDKHGNVSYQDSPPPPEAGRVEEKTLRGTPSMRRAEGQARPAIVLYVVPDCAPCDLVRAVLQRRKLAFTETNVEGDGAAQQVMKKATGGLSVPAVTIGEKVVKGYSEAALNAELDAAGYGPAAPAQETAAATADAGNDDEEDDDREDDAR